MTFCVPKVGGSLAVSLAFNVVNAKARRGISGATSGPRAVKRPHPVPFGKVGEENRGKVRVFFAGGGGALQQTEKELHKPYL